MEKNLYIDASHPDETRVVLKENGNIEDYEYETVKNNLIKNNIYLGKVSRVEPSLQAAFIDFGRERHGFLSFNDIQSDYYQIPKADLDKIKEYCPYIEHILLDSKQKQDMPGGTGQTFDWKIIKNFCPNKSFFLSGGLNTNNISEALNLKKTEYFDVSSGVENSEGIKDEKLISEFISKANKAVK